MATILVTTGSQPVADSPSDTGEPTTTVDTSEFASSADDGPVEIITEDPTCAAWNSISDALTKAASNGWDDRDPTIPASDWTASQRQQHDEIGLAMRAAAEQTAALIKLTPHRVVRELYEQSVAYWTAYADKLPNYEPADDHLAGVATGTSNSLVWICSSIHYGVAQSRAPFVVPAPAPKTIPLPQDPTDPDRFMSEPLSVCREWAAELDSYGEATAAWFATDPGIPGPQWSSQQQAIYADVSVVMQENANTIQEIGIRSGNTVFDDFAALASQYRRAYVQSFTTYVPDDTYLANAATELVVANNQACLAAGAS